MENENFEHSTDQNDPNWNTRQKVWNVFPCCFSLLTLQLWNDGKPKWWEIYACINLSLVGISDWPAMSYENCSQVGELRKLLLQTNNKKHSWFRKKMVYQKIVRNIHNYKIQILTYVKVTQVTKRFFLFNWFLVLLHVLDPWKLKKQTLKAQSLNIGQIKLKAK